MVMHRHTHTFCMQHPLPTTWKNDFQRRAKAQKCNSFYILQVQIQAFQNTRLLFMPIDIHITEFQLQRCSGKQLAELNA